MQYIRLMLTLVVTTITLSAQWCPLDARVTRTAMRTGNNSMYGAAIAWAESGHWWEWQAQVDGSLLFAAPSGAFQSIASGQNFGWLNGLGQSNGRIWATTQALEPRGSGQYRSEGSGVFIAPGCGAGGTIPNASSPAQSIQRPARPDYQTTPHQNAIMFLGVGNSGTASYRNHAVLVPGNSNGATGSPSWELLQSGAKPAYAVLSGATGSSATVTAVSYSDGCGVYNVQVKTNYGGFFSEPMYIFINRPHAMVYRYWEDLHTPLGSGYATLLEYETWTVCNDIKMDAYGFNSYPDGSSSSFSNWPPITNITSAASSSVMNMVILSPPANTCGSGSDPCNPEPMNPQSPLGNAEMQQRFETWRIGNALVPGSGVPVQNSLSRRYRDHAAHTNFTTPLLTD